MNITMRISMVMSGLAFCVLNSVYCRGLSVKFAELVIRHGPNRKISIWLSAKATLHFDDECERKTSAQED